MMAGLTVAVPTTASAAGLDPADRGPYAGNSQAMAARLLST